MIITGMWQTATIPVARREVNVAVGSDGHRSDTAEHVLEQWGLRADVPARRRRIEIDAPKLFAAEAPDE